MERCITAQTMGTETLSALLSIKPNTMPDMNAFLSSKALKYYFN